jgi:hypothetical protein
MCLCSSSPPETSDEGALRAPTRVDVGSVGVSVVHGAGTVDPQERQCRAAAVGQNGGGALRRAQRTQAVGPAGGQEGLGRGIEIVQA